MRSENDFRLSLSTAVLRLNNKIVRWTTCSIWYRLALAISDRIIANDWLTVNDEKEEEKSNKSDNNIWLENCNSRKVKSYALS